MAVCELCGAEGVSTNKGIVSNVSVEVCTRCTETMGIELHRSPFEQKRPQLLKPMPQRRTQSDKTELSSDFHIRLRKARDSKGWTQQELARRMNVRVNLIQKAESGTRPTDDLISKLEKVLNVKLKEDSDVVHDSMISPTSSRGLTIADALDEFLQGDSDG